MHLPRFISSSSASITVDTSSQPFGGALRFLYRASIPLLAMVAYDGKSRELTTLVLLDVFLLQVRPYIGGVH